MNNQTAGNQAASPLYRWERVIASLTVAWVMGLTTYMIFQEHALSNTSVYFLKIVLSLSGGVMLATLPGFFDINYTFGGLSVRAAGGAAAFIFIYTQSPALPALQNAHEPGAAGAHPYREQHKPDKSSMRGDGFPVLMALSLSPAGFASRDSYYQQTAVHVDGGGGDPGGSSGGGLLAGGGGISIGEAVARDLSALGRTVMSYAGRTLSTAKYWVDQAAALLRTAVGKTVGLARNLLGIDAPGGQPQTIALLGEEGLEPLTDVTGALLGSEQGLLGGLTVSLGNSTTALLGGLSGTVGGLVATTDATVSGLVTGVHGVTNQLLDTTDTLVSNVTGLLDNTTGGLTSRLTAPVEKLTDGLTDATGKVVDTVLPQAVTATSKVFNTVDKGFERITDRLNEITPAIIGKLDPDFAATDGHAARLDQLTGALRGPLLDDRLSTVAALPNRVLGKLGDGELLRGGGLRPAGGDFDTSQSRCISGCGGPVAGTVSGLRDTVGGLSGGLRGRGDAGASGLLGGNQAGSGLGLAGGGGGDGGPGGGADQSGGGGPIAGTLQGTRSLVGGTVRSLRRR